MATLRTLFLDGKAGRLEALLNLPVAEDGAVSAGDSGVATDSPLSALACHPHPAGGGTMHNKVVYHAMKTLTGLGIPTLRFNFRGVGASEGAHDDGHGEQDDVRTALDWLSAEFAQPVLFVGFSFGSAVGMRACCPDARVIGLAALGLPVAHDTRRYDYPWLASCVKPKLFLSGSRDEYGPRDGVEAIVARAAGDNRMVWIDGGDHFFQSPEGPKLALMQTALRCWVEEKFLAEF